MHASENHAREGLFLSLPSTSGSIHCVPLNHRGCLLSLYAVSAANHLIPRFSLMKVAVPNLSVSDNRSPLSFLYWAIVPHLLWALVVTVWTGIVGVCKLVCWYFGHTQV